MKIKINKKHYLLGVITLLFIVALGLIGWVKGAGAIHKDLRLRIDTLDFKYYNSNIKFSLKDSIIPNGYSPRCEYFVFEETEEGYDVPLSCSYIPSFIHPSVYRWTRSRYGYDDKNDNNINHINLLCFPKENANPLMSRGFILLCFIEHLFYFPIVRIKSIMRSNSSIE